MKKFLAVALVMMLSLALFANGTQEGGAASGFTPTKDVEWTCTSKPGGGSDIFTQQIKDALKTQGITDANVVISYVTDGGGEVGRLQVAMTGKNKADYTLLTFNSGDLMPMVKNTDNRIENFTPLAVMAVDKQLLFIGENAKYKTWQEVLDAIKAGKKVVIAGSKGDDIETYNKLIAELGVSEAQLSYITNDSTSGAITSLLGGHVDLCMSKPAAAAQYVEAGKMKAILALSESRFTAPSLKDAPTLSEFVVGPKAMSEEAAAFWSECLRQVSESQVWQENYIAKNGLVSEFKDYKAAKEYMTQYQADYLKSLGK